MHKVPVRRLLAAAVMSTLFSTGLVAVAQGSHADSNLTLSTLTTFSHMQVDSTHLFITSGSGTSSILVTNYSGATVATISNQPGADGMALSADSSTLYVALSGGDAVSAISTSSLTQTVRYSTGASTCPHSVGVAGGKIYFSYGCSGGSGNIGSIDTSTSPATVTLNLATGWYSAPLLATSKGNTNLLVAGEQGQSPSSGKIYNVSTGAPVLVASNNNLGGNLGDIKVSPDGSKIYVSDGGVYYQQVFSSADFSNVGQYSTGGPYPTAVALSADGKVVATGRNGSPDVYLYKVGSSSAYRNLTFSDYNNGYSYEVAPGGMAFAPGGSVLFIMSTAFSSKPVLHLITTPERMPSSIRLTVPSTATRGSALSISGTLSVTGGSITTPQTLTVKKTDLAGSHTLPNVTTTSTGTFQFSDTPQIGGSNTYTVSWAGNAANFPTSSHGTVTVSRLATSISITTNGTTYNYNQTVTITAHLGTTYNSRTVTIYATPKGLSKTTVKTGTVDSAGNLTATYLPTRNTTFTAAFAGDYRYAPASASRLVYTRVNLSGKMLNYYTTSGGYYIYHQSVNPNFFAQAAPNDKVGENLCFPLQVYSGGSWTTIVNNCFAMDSTSATTIIISGTNTQGIPYRVRASFSGDSTNAAQNSSWYYFKFTS